MSHQIEEPLSPDSAETQDATSHASPDSGADNTTVEAASASEPTVEEPEAMSEDVTSETSSSASDAETAAAEETPVAEAKAEETPAAETKAEETPVAEAKAEETPAAEAKAEETPAAEAKAEETPAAEAKAEETPVAEAKAEETPAAEAKAEETPAAEAKADEAPAVEAKAEETPAADEAPAVEAKAEETPAAEAKAEETPVVEAVAVEATAEGTPAAEGDEPAAMMAKLEQALADKTAIDGQVIGWNKGGYHVAIGKVAAFCPVSQIEIGNPRSPKRYLDRSFKFNVIEIQQDGRRVVVSRANALKAEREAKAALVRERLNVGDKLEGKVSSITSFGAFVDLGGGIEGLVHISELSRRRVENAKELVKVGQQVNVQVLKIEKNGQRISLSMKRLEKDPWSGVAERFPAGDTFEGKVLRKTEFGLFVEVEPGLEGLIHLSRLPHGLTVEDEGLGIGQTVKGWIHEVDAKRRRLSLSLREVSSSNPWKGVRDRFPEGEIVNGTVERLARFGVFVELEPGLTGLLPFSNLAGIANPRRQYHPGKEVQVRVLSIDMDRKRISLGTEQSKAVGSQQDYKEYLKGAKKQEKGGMTALAAAFARLKGGDQDQQSQ